MAARLLVAWGTVIAFFAFGTELLADLESPLKSTVLFIWLFAVIGWCAFGVVEHAEHLAELLGEPLGTLILTLSIVVIEVALISAVMLTSDAAPTLGRDTMFALLMIILNGVVGLALLLGGIRHHTQEYNLQGAAAFLAVIVPLSVIALVLPNFTRSTRDPSLTGVQAFSLALFTILLYGVFLAVQTVRHRSFFVAPQSAGAPASDDHGAHDSRARPSPQEIGIQTLLLIMIVVPIVLLAKQLATLVDHGIAALGAPAALGGVLIALIVFTPEGMSALRAALDNQLQRAVNLCLGAALSTIGLTVPAVLAIGLLTGQPVILGLGSAEMVLLAVTLAVSMLTFSVSRTTVLEGAVHLVLFFFYIVLIFSP
ncbi:MAG: calcium:proton antiporter [Gammaproteobacteria bacterium]|nr:calcium:proton antiporter [Gammaproteobacteria bacterium]